MNVNDIMICILRAQICNQEIDRKVLELIDANMLKSLFVTAKKYDVVHIIALWLEQYKVQMSENVTEHFRKSLALAVYRYEHMNYDYERICKTFEEEKIPYIPLKGLVIRDFYPEPWMRTSCDIDILVKEEDLKRAMTALEEKLSFKSDEKRNYHDVSMYSKNNTHLELHFNIKENMNYIDGVLSDVWKYAVIDEGSKYKYKLKSEFLLFQIISHIVYHIKCGGSGIRAFIDLYLLEKNISYDEAELSRLCGQCSIEIFRKTVEKLCAVWMQNEEHNTVTKQLQNFIFDGGLYGSIENVVAIRQSKAGGKTKYVFTLIFQPYEIMKEKYPVLKKYKWLIPFYHIKRWCNLALSGRGKKVVCYLKSDKGFAEDENDKKIQLFKNLGIY